MGLDSLKYHYLVIMLQSIHDIVHVISFVSRGCVDINFNSMLNSVQGYHLKHILHQSNLDSLQTEQLIKVMTLVYVFVQISMITSFTFNARL